MTASMSAAIINLENVAFRRSGCVILAGVSWRIEPGQHWALLGANGSGKTTLLKIITGYEWPSSGKVSVLGAEFGKCALRELRKTIGWVSFALEPMVPGRDRAIEVVASGIDASIGLYRKLAGDELRRAKTALRKVNGLDFADRIFRVLSQGEQQRVLIARALVNDPKLIILDEPCVGLDPAAREYFLSDIERLATCGNSPNIIFVTHHIEEIRPWITHLLLLKNGKKLAAGKCRQVITSAKLSEAFDCRCSVIKHDKKYSLTIER